MKTSGSHFVVNVHLRGLMNVICRSPELILSMRVYCLFLDPLDISSSASTSLRKSSTLDVPIIASMDVHRFRPSCVFFWNYRGYRVVLGAKVTSRHMPRLSNKPRISTSTIWLPALLRSFQTCQGPSWSFGCSQESLTGICCRLDAVGACLSTSFPDASQPLTMPHCVAG